MENSACNQWDREPGIELKPSVSRRNLLKAAAIGLGALGFSATAEAAMAASTQVKVGKASAIPVKSGKSYTLKGKYIIITQPKKGVFKAFTGICTHEGERITAVTGSNMVCRAHNASFNTTSGKVTGGPASRSLKTYKVTNKSGILYVTL